MAYLLQPHPSLKTLDISGVSFVRLTEIPMEIQMQNSIENSTENPTENSMEYPREYPGENSMEYPSENSMENSTENSRENSQIQQKIWLPNESFEDGSPLRFDISRWINESPKLISLDWINNFLVVPTVNSPILKRLEIYGNILENMEPPDDWLFDFDALQFCLNLEWIRIELPLKNGQTLQALEKMPKLLFFCLECPYFLRNSDLKALGKCTLLEDLELKFHRAPVDQILDFSPIANLRRLGRFWIWIDFFLTQENVEQMFRNHPPVHHLFFLCRDIEEEVLLSVANRIGNTMQHFHYECISSN